NFLVYIELDLFSKFKNYNRVLNAAKFCSDQKPTNMTMIMKYRTQITLAAPESVTNSKPSKPGLFTKKFGGG
ncbi:MAG TPA: hypothetical protein VE912_19905, partial [Bacteroidales bacterium]|nr:hypothetical protein [Bacteroidales bacterium]